MEWKMKVPEKYRIRNGKLATSIEDGNNGLFLIPAIGRLRPLPLTCIASDGSDWEKIGLPLPAWEHVSISTVDRVPNWAEMCLVKSLFWDGEDVVIQFHPREKDYVNVHHHTLHLWRPIGVELPTPPRVTV
jgi:hypothetical protein